MQPEHVPVLLETVLDYFNPKEGDRLLDATLGLGGHTKAFLETIDGKGNATGIEADKEALLVAKDRLAEFGDKVTYIHGNYYQLKDFPSSQLFTHILFDLGIGSHQLADTKRGFSFASEGEMTMKFGEAKELPPAKIASLNVLEKRLGYYPDVTDIIRQLNEQELADIIRYYAEEKFAWRIAKAIKEDLPMTVVGLVDSIKRAVPDFYERGRIHPATRTFQGLRLAVNRELEVLEATIPIVIKLLAPGGVIGIISFHSLEDRIVKTIFKKEATDCICPPEEIQCKCEHTASLEILTKKPVMAGEEEIKQNPRSRSAKLRVAKKK